MGGLQFGVRSTNDTGTVTMRIIFQLGTKMKCMRVPDVSPLSLDPHGLLSVTYSNTFKQVMGEKNCSDCAAMLFIPSPLRLHLC
jgi:hypothetical protein